VIHTIRSGFRNWPIRLKLIFTGLLTSSIALMLAGTSIVGYQWYQYRSDVAAELTSVADMIAVNSSAPLIFGDQRSAARTLAPIKAETRVAEVAVYQTGGDLFATFVRLGINDAHFPPAARIGDQGFEWFSLRVARAIVVDGENVGAVYIRSDMPDLGPRLYRNASIMAGVMFVAALVALFATSVLQRLISQPIQHLANVAREVSSGNNYAVRAVRETSDELGVLTDAFNSMLEQIESRDQVLETKVTMRTAELTRSNEDLIVARDKAEEGARLKSEFLANMSHEIRTPMNIIIGMTQLTLDTRLDTRQKRHLSMVRSSADALLTIVNDILDFSKIEAGKLDLDMVEFGLAECIRERTASLSIRAQEKGLDLNIQIDEDVPDTIVGDPVRVGQIVVNLVGNAIKFSSTGKIGIHVSLEDQLTLKEKTGADAALLRFSIADDGIGIPADKLGTIFEAFTQADGSTTRRYGGTGLGLSISRKLVEMMGGRIWVRSEVGRGSQFTFTVLAALPKQIPVQAAAAPGSETARGMVVMPDREQRDLLAEMLTNWHIEAASMDSPAAAIEVMKWSGRVGRTFSFALIDSVLAADEQGRFLREMGVNPELALVRIVLVDRSGSLPTAPGGPAAIEWPVSQSALLQVIADLLGSQRNTSKSMRALATALGAQTTSEGTAVWDRLRRILVAEDNAANRELIMALLETRVPTEAVRMVGDGREALLAAGEEQFDLILMDIQMPQLGGNEAAAAIRLIDARRGVHTPIVAITANAMKGDREIYIAGGMDGYVSKPIDFDTMFLEIERVMTMPVSWDI